MQHVTPFTAWAIACASMLAAQPQSSQRLCSISGTVSDAMTGEPLRKVRLSLSATAYALSAPDGRFVFHGLQPGRYRLSGERQGYLRGEYGSKRSGAPGMEFLLLAEDKLENVHLKLLPQATISGRVLDPDGDPWVEGLVEVYRYVWRNGKRELQGSNGDEIDDRGQFRVSQLPPGRYFVLAGPNRYQQLRTHRAGNRLAELDQPTYYPGTLDPSSASPVVVSAGQEISGIEIRIRRSAVYTIRGTVVGLSEAETKRSPARFWEQAGLSAKSITSTQSCGGAIGKAGTFEIPGVLPGTYDISVVKGWGGAAALGKTTVQVDNRDVEDVQLAVTSPRALKGKVIIEGESDAKPSGIRLWLEPTTRVAWMQPISTEADGSFEFEQLGPEVFRVRIQSSDERLYLKAVRIGDKESASAVINLAATPDGHLNVLLSPNAAQIQGALEPIESSSTPQVWLIPDSDDAAERERWALPGQINQHGVFTIRGVRPGDYRIFAWQDLPEGLWKHREFLDSMMAESVRVSVSEGDRKALKLRLISSAAVEAAAAKLGIELN